MSEVADKGLALSGVTVERNGFPVVRNLDLHAPLGSVTVLLGPNGAGKTTVLEAISGVIPVAAGSIWFAGHPLAKLGRVRRSKLGIGHVEQGRNVFADLTVAENIEVAQRGSWSLDDAFSLFPELRSRRDVAAGMLSGGEQQMLVIARALAAEPKMLLLDELSLGLAPMIARQLIATVRRLADERGVGALLVEQFASLALAVGDTAYVLRDGGCIYEGPCQDVESDVLLGAYLAASAREPELSADDARLNARDSPRPASAPPGVSGATTPPVSGGAK